MRIPEELLQEIRDRISIVDLVGGQVALRRAGKNWKGLCPFHAEKTPSFVVNEERGTYHCFGCGEGGSAFRFLMEADGLSFPEAVRVLAARAGVELPADGDDPGARQERQERTQQLEVLDLAARYYRHQLLEGRAGAAARTYLEGRGVSAEAAETFLLGCAPAGWDNLTRFLRGKGADLELAQRAGLVAERRSGGFYDRLRDRLVFPITDPTGRVVSFGGRVLGAGEPKYLNGPDTEVFHKGALLYGLSQASQELRQTRRALLVEGYLDVIRLHEAGHRTALATLGTAVTREHLQLLRRRADEMVLIYDGDTAGRAAAFRALDTVLVEELPCRAVLLPDGEDPDSFVQGGGDLQGKVDDAQPLLDLYVRDRIEAAEPGGVAATVGALDAVLEKLRVVRDPVVRDLYLRRVAESVGVEESLLRRRLVESAAQHRPPEATEQGVAAPAPVDPVERELLRALVSSPEDRERFTRGRVEQWIRSPAALSALRYVVAQTVGAAQLDVEAAPASARRLLSEILVEGEVRGDPYEALVARLQLRALEEEAANLLAELRRAEAGKDGDRVGQLLQRQLQLGQDLAACKRQVRGRSGK